MKVEELREDVSKYAFTGKHDSDRWNPFDFDQNPVVDEISVEDLSKELDDIIGEE